MKNTFFQKNKRFAAGFTLVEMMVVIGIFILVSGLTIFNYGSYRSTVSLQNLSNDIALSVRKAQSYAIGVTGSGASFTYGYGVHFSTSQSPAVAHSGSNKSFVLFTDVSGDKMFQSDGTTCSTAVSASDECSEELSILTADQISAIYINSSIASIVAGTASAMPAGGSVDLLFFRPNPDAYFCYRQNPTLTNADVCDQSTGISNITIKVASMENSNVKYITIWNTGQISAR